MFRIRATALLLSTCSLAPVPLRAQMPTPAKDRGALTARTADHEVARLFVAAADTPDLPTQAAAHWKITLTTEGKFVAEVAEGLDRLLVVQAKAGGGAVARPRRVLRR